MTLITPEALVTAGWSGSPADGCFWREDVTLVSEAGKWFVLRYEDDGWRREWPVQTMEQLEVLVSCVEL
jgi:hypothetical protein